MHSILVVEDEKHLLDLYRSEFEDVGYAVLPVATGRDAIASVRKQRPDLVILDIKLNDMEGLQVLDEIKAIDKTIPVIINSAYSVYKSDFSSWMADDYIVKSSDTSILLNKVKEIIGNN
ncbi:MAG: response regulator [Candidatus Zixiibacteriota bacterium]|nr:MAG: response regulator [candidate division Zixibacteria bacterium]